MLTEDSFLDKSPKISVTQEVFIHKKNKLQQALRYNPIITKGPTNPGRYISILTNIINLAYQCPSSIYFNDLIKQMHGAYEEYLNAADSNKHNLRQALTLALEFLNEVFHDEFVNRKLPEQFSALNLPCFQQKPAKPGFFQSFSDACCCFFPCLTSRKKNSSSINQSTDNEPLLSPNKRNYYS